MQANDQMYATLVDGRVQFVIPVFQRNYNWDEEQCEQLWEDILRVGNNTNGGHFFGPIVYTQAEDHNAALPKWLLIDGQQRMTTVSLLMAAVRDHIKDQSSSSSKIKLNADMVESDFLNNSYESDDGRPKLKLRKRDEATLRWIVDKDEEPSEKSVTVEKNYEFFRKKLHDADPDAVHAGVRKLAVVDVRLDRNKDDPQQIFESLNSTGLDLTQADLVRNYVLMGLGETLQIKFYNKYWHKIEHSYTGSEGQLDNFLLNFVALDTKAQKQGRADQVYSSFRIAFGEHKQDPDRLEELLRRMVQFSRYHAAFTMGTGEFEHVAEHMARLRVLATTPTILVMKLLDGYEQEYLDDDSLADALDLIESYIVRRDVCGFQTRSYREHFAKLAYGLREGDYLKFLKVNLHSLTDNYAFPTDREFRHGLEQEELYGRRICRTVLERLENADSRERADTIAYTIEHIMPQNPSLSRDWKRMLGSDWQNVHETWLHRLGNLTLTAYNQEYSDLPFDKKKTIKHGFDDSPLRLNKGVRDQAQWTAKEMEERGRHLACRALRIWPSLDVPREWVEEAEVTRLLAERGDIQATRDDMDDDARKLFDAFHKQVKTLDENVIDVARPKSVSYHSPSAEFFCEILPRTRSVVALFRIDAEEAVKCDIAVADAAQRRRAFNNAHHDAGSYVGIHSVEDVRACKPLVLQALAASAY